MREDSASRMQELSLSCGKIEAHALNTVNAVSSEKPLVRIKKSGQNSFPQRFGEVAQLGERCVRNAEVGSSILLFSTT